MLDPEFEKLLREGYEFRGNHIRILEFLGGKEASAEEIEARWRRGFELRIGREGAGGSLTLPTAATWAE